MAQLRHRALVGEVLATRAQLNFAKGPTKDQDQTHIDESWTKVVEDLFPFKINRFEIRDSEVRFHDLARNQKWMCLSRNLYVICHNITTVE